MERKISFRGKVVDNAEWVYGNLVMVCDGETLKRYPCIVVSYNHDTFDWNEVIRKTVGQFTNKIDKNSKDVYENDIVKYKYWICTSVNPDSVGITFNGIGIITFIEGCFMVKPIKENPIPLCYSDLEIEVIGNNFDNPELLNEGKKN